MRIRNYSLLAFHPFTSLTEKKRKLWKSLLHEYHDGTMDIYQITGIHNQMTDMHTDSWLDWICLTTTHVLQDILAVLHK